MVNKMKLVALGLVTMTAFSAVEAQTVEFRGVKNTMRYDDGDDTKYEYLGWDSATGTAVFKGDVGLWKLNMNDNNVSSELVQYDNLMYGNSGSVYVDGYIYTVMSHEDPDADTSDVYEFVVRKWNAETFELVSTQRFPKSANLESRGMALNPQDRKVYGLFYLTDVQLPVPEEELDQEDRDEGYTTDAGYALCTIDLGTMEISQITPGVYYDNFVTLACSAEGRLFSMTSGGTMVEFDSQTGLIKTKTVINEEGAPEEVNIYNHSGVQSQFKRQAACFDYTTGKMYWNGYVNSGKGYNEWGSWGNLPDREWKTNGKFDTALYEVNLETGAATKIANIPNRIAFSCLWIVGSEPTGIEAVESANDNVEIYNAAGQLVYTGTEQPSLSKGLYIIKNGTETKKVLKK